MCTLVFLSHNLCRFWNQILDLISLHEMIAILHLKSCVRVGLQFIDRFYLYDTFFSLKFSVPAYLLPVFQMLSYHATCSKVEVDRLKVILEEAGWETTFICQSSLTFWMYDCWCGWRWSSFCAMRFSALSVGSAEWLTDLSSPPQAAKIPLSTELGIDEFHFNDFSLDNDAMITASLRMFLELGVVQKFKIDYEVRPCIIGETY